MLGALYCQLLVDRLSFAIQGFVTYSERLVTKGGFL